MNDNLAVPEHQKARQVISRLEQLADPEAVKSLARFAIRGHGALGVKIPVLRQMAKEIGRDHNLALALWKTEIHEARILASMVDDPGQVSAAQMDAWAADFDSWDVCDQVCSNLFDRTPFAYDKALEWSGRPEAFVKRAAFSLMAALSVHDKQAPDSKFKPFLPVIMRESGDDRNFVKKAVNWALRQIGKRSRDLNQKAIGTAEEILQLGTGAGRWIAVDALRELRGEKVQRRLQR